MATFAHYPSVCSRSPPRPVFSNPSNYGHTTLIWRSPLAPSRLPRRCTTEYLNCELQMLRSVLVAQHSQSAHFDESCHQIIVNYAAFLEENQYFEESFKVSVYPRFHQILMLICGR